MGLFKWLCRRFKCMSSCTFNEQNFDLELLKIDLSQYKLKKEDLMLIDEIARKRPSIHTYKHQRENLQKNSTV